MRAAGSSRASLAAASAVLLAGCANRPADVAAPSTDPRGGAIVAEVGDAQASDSYVYVARRPRVTIARAEARGITEAEGIAMVERLAADFSGCAARLAAEGHLVAGAGRVVMVAGPRGMPEGFNVRLAPGGDVAQNALMCLIAPAKMLVFPTSDGGQRGLAIETTWGP